jgi:hypothetical protein
VGTQGTTVKLRREALGRSQRSLLPRLAPLARQHGFYLAGGTTLGRLFGLPEMLAFYRKKYGVEDDGHILVALTYFDDADRERTPILLHRHSWPVMKAAIRGWVSGTAGRR